MRDDRQLDLLAWAPPAGPAGVVPFPLDRRLGKIRDVAGKLLAKTTDRAVAHYRRQVTDALLVNLRSKRVPEERHADELRRFWLAVDLEVARRLYGKKGGAA